MPRRFTIASATLFAAFAAAFVGAAIAQSYPSPDLIARLTKIGLEVHSSTPEQINARVESEFRKWSDVLATAIKVE